ncbi:MAG: SDR family oxidoreductase [Planctomycetota bacterium]|nr:SDR family oxidoreductase [Planctomycetota bacterium]
MDVKKLFDLTGKVAVVTGASGVLGGCICKALAQSGVKVGVMDIRPEPTQALVTEIKRAGGEALAMGGNVLDKAAVEKERDAVLKQWGRVDFLLNYAGGNNPKATATAEQPFFDIPKEALERCLSLNVTGSVVPSQVFGKVMASQNEGVILNVSSMNAFRPLTRIIAYSAAKAAVSNFTQWLAVHMAQNYSPKIRVNAIAPGFFLTDQNRYLLTDKSTGARTPRGEAIIAHTPMGRYGEPEDLTGTVLWLLSPAAAFVTGVVVPIDGGFSAFSGV